MVKEINFEDQIQKKKNNTDSMENKKYIYYTALFVKDVENLLKKFPPKHSKIYGHHSTVAFEPGNLGRIEVGKKVKIKIIARVYDEKGDTLLVENEKSEIKYPHITLSCADGTDAVYSNELLKKTIESGSIKYFKDPIEIEAVEGYSDGKKDFVGIEKD